MVYFPRTGGHLLVIEQPRGSWRMPSFGQQAPRERVRAPVAQPSRSSAQDKEAGLSDAERFFSLPRFASSSEEADGAESRTPLGAADGNKMATKPSVSSISSAKRLASLQQALTRAMAAVKQQDTQLEECARDRDRYAQSLSVAVDRAAAMERTTELTESEIVPGLRAEISELILELEGMKERERASVKARENDAVADKIRVAKDRARVMEAEEDAASFRERLEAATRASESLVAEKTSLETTVMSQASRIDRMLTQAEARKGALRMAEESLADAADEIDELRRKLDEALADAGKATELARAKERERRALAIRVEEADEVKDRETSSLRDEAERLRARAEAAEAIEAELRARLDASAVARDDAMGTHRAAAEELAASLAAHEALSAELEALNARLRSAVGETAATREEKGELERQLRELRETRATEISEASSARADDSSARANDSPGRADDSPGRADESPGRAVSPHDGWAAERASMEKELATLREELAKADDAQDAAIEWARSAAKEEAEAAWAAQVEDSSARVRAAEEKARAAGLKYAAELEAASAAAAAERAASSSSEKVTELESSLAEARVSLDLARADAKAMSAAAADLDAELTKTKASHAEDVRELRASAEASVARLRAELDPLKKRAEDAEVSLMTASHNERRLRAQLREAEDRGARALADLATELQQAESMAVERMMASEQNAAKADENNARLARELWESRQKFDREIKQLADELDKARRRAAEAIRERPMRRPGAVTGDESVNEAVIAELQRELEAEMKTSEAAAAESARREGVTRRKLADLEARVAEANAALAQATKAIDEKDAALAKADGRIGSLESALRKLEVKALKCEDIAAVERAEKADLLDVRDAKEALAARVRALEGDVEAARSRAVAAEKHLADAKESMTFLENEARDAARDATEARAGWQRAEALAGDANLLNSEIHRLKLELKGASDDLDEREAEIEEYSRSVDAFAGMDNEAQRVKHHQRVKEHRDQLKKEVAAGKSRLRRAEAALRLMCTATETQRAQLIKDARCRSEDFDVAGKTNRRLSSWAEDEHETGDEANGAADETWETTVAFLAHLKLPVE